MLKPITLALSSAALIQTSLAGDADAFIEPMTPVQESSDDWEFKLSIYGPIVGLDGTSRIGPAVIPIDIGFDDILDNLDGGIVLAGEARKGRWSLTGDFIWLKISTSVSPTPTSYVATKVEQTVGSLALGYELYEDSCWTVDALVGGAYTGLDISSTVSILPPLPPGAGVNNTFVGADESWVDPFIGLRFRYRAGDKWRFFGRVDYGGFGIASETYFQAIAGAGYQINDCVGLFAAYRFLSVDYEKAAFAYDVETSGPQVGLVFQF